MNTKAKSKKARAAVKYGKVELSADEFSPRHIKIRITTMLDEDILHSLKEIADERGMRYQTLINDVLRKFVDAENGTAPLTLDSIRKLVKEEIGKHLETN